MMWPMCDSPPSIAISAKPRIFAPYSANCPARLRMRRGPLPEDSNERPARMNGPAARAIAADPAADARFMALAFALGRRGLGNTWPNPAVGAVVVGHGIAGPRIVGRGWTQRGGRPHAEIEALGRAAGQARGAALYVTLEPCSHHGRSPPCADAIIAAGIERVVSALEDPNPKVAG